MRGAFSRPFTALARGLAGLAGAPDPGIGWRLLEGPLFDNPVGTLRFDGRHATLGLDKTVAVGERDARFERSFQRRLA